MSDTLSDRLRQMVGDTNEELDTLWEAADKIEHLQAERKRLRRIIYNLLDDGDETDRAAARAVLAEKEDK